MRARVKMQKKKDRNSDREEEQCICTYRRVGSADDTGKQVKAAVLQLHLHTIQRLHKTRFDTARL